jgi:hypothetical protein
MGQEPYRNETEERLEEEMKNAPLTTHVDLLPKDADALRMKVHQMLTAFMAWERKSLLLSDLVMRAVASGDKDRVIEEILAQSPIRVANNRTLWEAVVTDFRLALLTSPDMKGKDLEYWLPEYKGRWKALDNVGVGQGKPENGGDPGSNEGGSGEDPGSIPQEVS